jgi:hypothetical protein
LTLDHSEKAPPQKVEAGCGAAFAARCAGAGSATAALGEVLESMIETKPSSILQFLHGLRGELYMTWEEGT